ncbi:MAG: hypothetical protein EOO06_08910 [Chitinophagaceae bacterium]|nr:MAG: hypothetical protein EOO06_08910 [Chitinophagaceae bacterium]
MMPTKLFKSAILLVILASCNNNRAQQQPQQAIPKALEEKSSSYELVSKRSYDDLVERLYSELVSKDSELKKLEGKIDELNESRTDSTESFQKFHGKNQSFFSAAETHVAGIKDSLIREKIKNLVAGQLTKYNSRIATQQQLLAQIETNQMAISDLHTVLKIVRTLPIIDKYQREQLPKATSLQGYLKHQEATIILADSLSKK